MECAETASQAKTDLNPGIPESSQQQQICQSAIFSNPEGHHETASQAKTDLNPGIPESSQQQQICPEGPEGHHQIQQHTNFDVDEEEDPIKCCKICGDVASG